MGLRLDWLAILKDSWKSAGEQRLITAVETSQVPDIRSLRYYGQGTGSKPRPRGSGGGQMRLKDEW
jgi:hypothetical protein